VRVRLRRGGRRRGRCSLTEHSMSARRLYRRRCGGREGWQAGGDRHRRGAGRCGRPGPFAAVIRRPPPGRAWLAAHRGRRRLRCAAGHRGDRPRRAGRVGSGCRPGDHRHARVRRVHVAHASRRSIHDCVGRHGAPRARPGADAVLARGASGAVRLRREHHGDDGSCEHARDRRLCGAGPPPRRARADVRHGGRHRGDVPVARGRDVPRRLERLGRPIPVHAVDLPVLVAGVRRSSSPAAQRAGRQLPGADTSDVCRAGPGPAGRRARRRCRVAASGSRALGARGARGRGRLLDPGGGRRGRSSPGQPDSRRRDRHAAPRHGGRERRLARRGAGGRNPATVVAVRPRVAL
jgi:hypothetical protein